MQLAPENIPPENIRKAISPRGIGRDQWHEISWKSVKDYGMVGAKKECFIGFPSFYKQSPATISISTFNKEQLTCKLTKLFFQYQYNALIVLAVLKLSKHLKHQHSTKDPQKIEGKKQIAIIYFPVFN